MEELAGLAEAANAEVLGKVVQVLEKPNTATMIGKGKVEEVAELVRNMEADMVIFNDELTGMQIRNLEGRHRCKSDRQDDLDFGYLCCQSRLERRQITG